MSDFQRKLRQQQQARAQQEMREKEEYDRQQQQMQREEQMREAAQRAEAKREQEMQQARVAFFQSLDPMVKSVLTVVGDEVWGRRFGFKKYILQTFPRHEAWIVGIFKYLFNDRISASTMNERGYSVNQTRSQSRSIYYGYLVKLSYEEKLFVVHGEQEKRCKISKADLERTIIDVKGPVSIYETEYVINADRYK